MRLVEYLVEVLTTQAQVLIEMRDLFGETVLLHALENRGEPPNESLSPDANIFKPPLTAEALDDSPYTLLQSAVRGAHLPAALEFHLWAYPHYRAWIESQAALHWRTRPSLTPPEESESLLILPALQTARSWVASFGFTPEIETKIARRVEQHWIRFRSKILQKLGRASIRPLIWLFIGLGLSWSAASISRAEINAASIQSVDLHAHLFMERGLGWIFKGSFEGPIESQSWESRFQSQINPLTLDQSGASIVVASLYAHPGLVSSLKESIHAQIQAAESFVKKDPQWILARSSSQAEQALKQGRKVLVLALEGASGILETESDLARFIDQGGIRIVTLLHLTDDELGGVAFLAGFRVWSSPGAWIKQFFSPRIEEGIRTNPRGLTPAGRELAKKLLDRKVWIDLAHASDAAQWELLPLLEQAGQPLLYSHTALRSFYGAERGLSLKQLEQVRRTHGIIGVMPSSEMLGVSVAEGRTSIQKFAEQYRQLAQTLSVESIMIGSDFNGGIPHLPGLRHMGFLPKIWSGLQAQGAKLPADPDAQVKRFLEAWKQVEGG